MPPVLNGQQSCRHACLINSHRLQHFMLPFTIAWVGMEADLVGSRQSVIEVVSKLGGFIVAARVVVDDSAQQALAQVSLQILLLCLLLPISHKPPSQPTSLATLSWKAWDCVHGVTRARLRGSTKNAPKCSKRTVIVHQQVGKAMTSQPMVHHSVQARCSPWHI